MDLIYTVNSASNTLAPVSPVPFAQIGVKERAQLEAWVIDNPKVLGEELLVITSEFDRFDKSDRRLDILALDKGSHLVVVELKLDLAKSYADQQAIRYAAFCSTMVMEDAVTEYAAYHGISEENAATAFQAFLESEDLPELEDPTRIILAAGSLDDPELTSTVLWLRSCGVDITCVELTPYKVGEGHPIILVPRTIIPVPEARDYIVRVERKEAKKIQQSKAATRYQGLWRAVADAFNALGTQFRATGNARGTYTKLHIGNSYVHYEWMWRRRAAALDVCLHFEWPSKARCTEAAERLKQHEEAIRKDIALDFRIEPFGKIWTQARVRLPFDGTIPDTEIATKAAATMKILIDRTYPVVKQILEDAD